MRSLLDAAREQLLRLQTCGLEPQGCASCQTVSSAWLHYAPQISFSLSERQTSSVAFPTNAFYLYARRLFSLGALERTVRVLVRGKTLHHHHHLSCLSTGVLLHGNGQSRIALSIAIPVW
jgi:hypothetical protein